jgi:MoCo/4Fe-4S cofactor protein with predicted Tat translocation signal
MELIQIKTGAGDGRAERKLDVKAVQEKLSAAQGPQYWRSLEELAATPEFEELLHNEFPRQASEWVGGNVSRRNFLQLASASLALAGLSGCTKMPTQKIVPYVQQPEELVLGRPQFYATAFTMNGCAQPVLARSNEGRPTKIEGNPEHPASKGAVDLFGQAAILELYDPKRSQTNHYIGEPRSWAAFLSGMAAPLASQAAGDGAGFRLLTSTVNSPTLISQIKALQGQYPQMKWYQWEPINRSSCYAGAQMAFGEPVESRYNFANADIVVSLDSDFLYSGHPGFALYSRDFADRRDPDEKANPKGMNRLYAIEGSSTATGYVADHRLPVKPSEVEQCARVLASRLGVGGAGGAIDPEVTKWLEVVAKDLQAHKGRAVVIVGERQPAVVHALGHAINEALGAAGSTVVYTDPIVPNTADQYAGIKELVGDMNAGKVNLLVMAGNPVYDAPADLSFGQALKNVAMKVHYGRHVDETGYACEWHVSATHFLEEWSDARCITGQASIVQPLIAPLYGSHSLHDLIAALSGQPDVTGYAAVRSYWQSQTKSANFEEFWRLSVHNGFVDGTEFQPKTVKVKSANFPAAQNQSRGIEIAFRPDPSVWDGRFANNGWLQELPRPLTRLTWDNAALVNYDQAARLGLSNDDLVELRYRGRTLEMPVWIMPGQAHDSITISLGYGRWKAGRVGTGVGFNAYTLRTSDALWFGDGLELVKTGRRHDLAATQHHFNMEGRDLVRAADLEEYRRDPEFARKPDAEHHRGLSLYPEPPRGQDAENAWGMAIDLNRCIGCGACVVACQAENNIAIVGKEEVLRSREMHWLRIDRYYEGTDLSNPRTYFQPVPCMHCEKAPCELVCPVGATTHSDEGLNEMTYNRCVGTRYCSNNCPYKVRRFNFLQYSDEVTPSLKLLHNPDVTIRPRGVMEKCTYCVQRINQARITAKIEDRAVGGNEVVTACQAACPAKAIIFGNLRDPASNVAKAKESNRNYALLAGLNTFPRTTYLARLRNPNPEIAGTDNNQAESRDGKPTG